MSATAVSKGVKRSMVKIGTHSGTFHCDEALGCWMLRQTDKFRDAEIVRSRDPEVLKDMDVVIDVGALYEPANMRYDHHQRGFTEVFGHGFNTKLSSAGLVYKHHGHEVIANVLNWPKDHSDLQSVYLQVYRNFVEAVDAIDNGIHQWEGNAPPKYLNNTTLSSRVGNLVPKWNEEYTDEILDKKFTMAMELAGGEMKEAIEYSAKTWLPGRQIVKESLEKRHEVDASGQILKLDKVCPWKEHLYNLEEEMGLAEKPILFVLYEDEREKKWRIQAVSVGPGSFENRLSMPEAWRGVRDDKLSEVAGIPGCVFCHAAGFIGGNDTFEGAVEMARKSLAAA